MWSGGKIVKMSTLKEETWFSIFFEVSKLCLTTIFTCSQKELQLVLGGQKLSVSDGHEGTYSGVSIISTGR